MNFTGERFLPGIEGNIELEHIHRYLLSKSLVKNMDVLDIACGEGYGSYILSDEAHKVYGVDVSLDTIKQAKTKYQRSNLDFRIGDCREIPIADSSVDAVVSFETIEHINEQDQFLSEIKRVLRPDGILVISSPDKQTYTLGTGIKNPFHEKELFDFEFREKIFLYFKHAKFMGQRVVFGSGIVESDSKNLFISFAPVKDNYRTYENLIDPIYWIAVASDVNVPVLTNSLYERSINESEIVRDWIKIRDEALIQIQDKDKHLTVEKERALEKDEEINRLNLIVADKAAELTTEKERALEKDEEINRLNSAAKVTETVFEEKNKIIEHVRHTQQELLNQINDLEQKLVDKQRELHECESTISKILTSKSWTITRPFRKILGKS